MEADTLSGSRPQKVFPGHEFSVAIKRESLTLFIGKKHSYGWYLGNIAKISPKMTKKWPFLDFSRFSQKLSTRLNELFLQSFYIILVSYMCNGIKTVLLWSEKQNINFSESDRKCLICFCIVQPVPDSFTTHAALVFVVSTKPIVEIKNSTVLWKV